MSSHREEIAVPPQHVTELMARVKKICSRKAAPHVLKLNADLWKWVGTWAELKDGVDYTIDLHRRVLVGDRLPLVEPLSAVEEEKEIKRQLREGVTRDRADLVPTPKRPVARTAAMTPPPPLSNRVHASQPEPSPESVATGRLHRQRLLESWTPPVDKPVSKEYIALWLETGSDPDGVFVEEDS